MPAQTDNKWFEGARELIGSRPNEKKAVPCRANNDGKTIRVAVRKCFRGEAEAESSSRSIIAEAITRGSEARFDSDVAICFLEAAHA